MTDTQLNTLLAATGWLVAAALWLELKLAKRAHAKKFNAQNGAHYQELQRLATDVERAQHDIEHQHRHDLAKIQKRLEEAQRNYRDEAQSHRETMAELNEKQTALDNATGAAKRFKKKGSGGGSGMFWK